MSGVTFNRNRVKLKKLLGIRARLALLAVILVAPLMLERARSLEDTRAKQIAAASEEFANITQHSADTQREVISSVETMLKSAAYIRASGGIARSCEILRASLPTNLPWIRSIMIVAKDGLVQCSTLNMQVGPQSRRPRIFPEGAGNPRLRFQRLSVRQDQRPPDDDGGLSGGRNQSGGRFRRRCRHQYRLAVEDHDQSRRTAGNFIAAGGQRRRRYRRARRTRPA